MRRLVVLLAGLLLIPLLVSPAVAGGQDHGGGGGGGNGYDGVVVTVNRTVVKEGATVRVTAEGFDPRTDFGVYVNGVFINDASVRKNGRGSILIDLPPGVTGMVTIEVRGTRDDAPASASTLITVKPGHGTTTTTTTTSTTLPTTTSSTTSTTMATTTTTIPDFWTRFWNFVNALLCLFFGVAC